MNTSGIGSLLSGIGLFVCVGAILLIVLAFMLFRIITSPRNPNNQNMWNQRGPERPRYDNPDIDTSGGFGGIPTTGPDNTPPNPGFGSSGMNQNDAGFGNQKNDEDNRDITSGGGFGRG